MAKTYRKSFVVEYKGCFFHSLLELKFALLIEEKCSFLREPMAIFYDPTTLEPTSYIEQKTRKYIPDFLVRKWSDNTAYLIEIKPKVFKDEDELEKKRRVAENYVKKKQLDWKFKVLFDDQIQLNVAQHEKFKSIIESNRGLLRKLQMQRLDKKFNNHEVSYFSNVPLIDSKGVTKEDYIRYVKYGPI